MSHQRKPRLKNILDKVPPGFLVDTPWLRAQGVDPKSIHDYVARGWLERVVRGVYRRPLPDGSQASSEAPWQIPLLSLQRLMGCDAHLGGESALDLAGYAHYLSLGGPRRVHVYGDVPSWLHRMPSSTEFIVHGRTLFGEEDRTGVDDAAPGAAHGVGVEVWRWPLKVSSPERAILEALDDLPGHASFEGLDKIFEGLTTLRPKLLMALLMGCRSVKVRRLFFVFADRHQHGWRKHLDPSKIDFGSGPRALVEGGWLHPVYRIYVPRAFSPAAEAEGHA
jgi:hypothetical protein